MPRRPTSRRSPYDPDGDGFLHTPKPPDPSRPVPRETFKVKVEIGITDYAPPGPTSPVGKDVDANPIVTTRGGKVESEGKGKVLA